MEAIYLGANTAITSPSCLYFWDGDREFEIATVAVAMVLLQLRCLDV